MKPAPNFLNREFYTALGLFSLAFMSLYFSELDLFISDEAYKVTAFESCLTLSTLSMIGKVSGVAYAIYLLKNLFASHPHKTYRKKEAVFLISVLILGPGIVNNFILKPAFNRPRPYEVKRYDSSSTKIFVKVLVIVTDQNGKSFPSGHAGSAFFLIAPWFIRRIREKYGWMVFLLALLWGGAVSVFRILQGKHFFSDCLGSLCVVYFVAFFLSVTMRLYKA